MRILRIVGGNDGGGIFACESQFIQQLKNNGVIVDLIIVGTGSKYDIYSTLGNKAYYLPPLNASYSGSPFIRIFNIVKSLIYGRKYAKGLKSQISVEYSAIIYQRPTYIFLAGVLGNVLESNVLWHMAGVVGSETSRRIYNVLCNRYRIIPIGNSKYTAKTLGEICEHIVYPGFDETRIMGGVPTFREKLSISKNAPVYGMVARVSYGKAQDLLIEAFIKSDIVNQEGHLLIAGPIADENFGEKLKKTAKGLLGKQIHLVGELNSVCDFYASLDIAVSASRVAEGFGISVAEGLGAGKPVIAYKLGGPVEMITHNSNGWLVEAATVENYIEILNTSIDAKDKWAEMGKNAIESSKRFTAACNTELLITLVRKYSTILSDNETRK